MCVHVASALVMFKFDESLCLKDDHDDDDDNDDDDDDEKD